MFIFFQIKPSCICSVLCCLFDPLISSFLSLYLLFSICVMQCFPFLLKSICKSTNPSCKVGIVLRVLCYLYYKSDLTDTIFAPLNMLTSSLAFLLLCECVFAYICVCVCVWLWQGLVVCVFVTLLGHQGFQLYFSCLFQQILPSFIWLFGVLEFAVIEGYV